jgi:biopolymer transport protein ExbB/TolQ
METTMYFILGILTIVVPIFIGMIIMGLVKINRQQKQIKDLIEQINFQGRDFNDTFLDIRRSKENDDRNMYEQLRELEKQVQNHLDGLRRETKSYTDSRVDKLIDTYFEMKEVEKIKNTTREIVNKTKEIING